MFGIYVHIPFCVKKCGYCDFYSVPGISIPGIEYFSALVSQLDRDTANLELANKEVTSIYFGGGTPSLMPPDFFHKLISEIGKKLKISDNCEISCEVNPATVDLNWFREVAKTGINRISIGIQSFNNRLLSILGRIHSSEDAMRSIAEAQNASFQNISIDLMYAIANETSGELEDDLKIAMTFQQNHISAYQLTIEEGMPMFCRGTARRAPTESQTLTQMRMVARMFGRGGWPRYEISNFAKTGFECRHNLNYWRYGEYLGLGAGATSFLQMRRFTQIRDFEKYILGYVGAYCNTPLPTEDDAIDQKSAMAEFCFLGLRTTEGISTKQFEKLFGVSFDSVYGDIVDDLVANGLLKYNVGARHAVPLPIALTQKGLEISNQIFETFLLR